MPHIMKTSMKKRAALERLTYGSLLWSGHRARFPLFDTPVPCCRDHVRDLGMVRLPAELIPCPPGIGEKRRGITYPALATDDLEVASGYRPNGLDKLRYRYTEART